MAKKEKNPDVRLAYMTEEQLKQAALERKRQQELIAAHRKPKSTGEKKIENFWYHYRGATIGAIIAITLLGLLVKDIFFRVQPDVQIVMITETYVPQSYLDTLTAAMQAATEDLNGDGQVLIRVDYLSHTPMAFTAGEPLSEEALAEGTPEQIVQDYNATLKLTTILAAASDPVFLLDEGNYCYLQEMSDSESMEEEDDMFLSLEELPGSKGKALPLSATVLADAGLEDYFLENLSFYFRQIRLTEKSEAYNNQCYAFLEKMAGQNG